MTALSIGEKLTLLRTRKKLSKKDLAEATNMHWTSISKYERNEAIPSLEALRKLALIFEVSADYLLFDNLEQQPKIQDKELMQKLIEADQLNDSSRKTLKNLIQSFLDSQEN